MRSSRRSFSTRVSVALGLVIAVVGLCVFAGLAQAASPAWKLLAVTGPTNLPPKQSEVQRVAVEGEGGTFKLGFKEQMVTREVEAAPVVVEAHLSFTAGSAVARIEGVAGGASLEVDARVTFAGVYEYGTERTILSCSADCETPGSTVTLSEAATETVSDAGVEVFTKKLTGLTGTLHVGEEIAGEIYEYYAPGTVVTAAGAGTATLSNPTTFEYLTSEGAIPLVATERIPAEYTAPIAYDASPQEVQDALQALPSLGAGSVTVSGGPGGGAENPYYVDYAGQLAETNVRQLEFESGGLVGVHAAVHVVTVVPGGAGTGEIAIAPADIGGAATSGEFTVQLGPLPEGIVTSGHGAGEGWSCPGGAGLRTVTCTSTIAVGALSPPEPVRIPVEINAAVGSASSAPITISGGGGAGASYQVPIVVSAEPARPGIQAFWAGAFDADGASEVQASGHPYSAQAYFLLNTVRAASGNIVPAADSRDVKADLPPGFLGDPQATARCPQSQLTSKTDVNKSGSPLCNGEMVVGKFVPVISEFDKLTPPENVWNDIPAQGSAAEFTTIIAGPNQSLFGSIRSSEDFGVRIDAPNNPTYAKIYGSYIALEGEPAAAHGKAFLTSPSDCAVQQEESARGEGPTTQLEASSWQEPTVFSGINDPLPLLTGCQPLTEAWTGKGPEPEKEEPSFSFQPTVTQGSSGTGATADLHVPQEGLTDPNKLATSDLKKAVVTLPQGLSVNPSAANGLEGCSEAQIGYLGSGFPSPNPTHFNEAPPACPEGSKLGTFEISTPLLEEKLEGTIYLAAQEENPFHSLIALYLVVDSSRFGVTLKLPGEVKADPATGQLTATFDDNPQLPFEDLTLHFRGGGPRRSCGASR